MPTKERNIAMMGYRSVGESPPRIPLEPADVVAVGHL